MSATALYKALIEAKVSEESAEKAVEDVEFARDVATKADLNAGLAQLRAEIAGSEVRMVKWNIALHIAFAGLIIGAIKFL